MNKFRLILLLACCTLGSLAVVPAIAGAKTIEVGKIGGPRDPKPECPQDCAVVDRTTAYPIRMGKVHNPYVVPYDGKVVAWSVSLGTPINRHIQTFNRNFGAPMGGITLLRKKLKTVKRTIRRRGKRPITRTTRVDDNTAVVVGQSPQQRLEPYFGQTVQFPLSRPLQVRKGDIIGFTTEGWVPMFARNQADTVWRTSRQNGQCEDYGRQTAQTRIGATTKYSCVYSATRPLYGYTLISYPRPTPKPKPKPKARPKAAPKRKATTQRRAPAKPKQAPRRTTRR